MSRLPVARTGTSRIRGGTVGPHRSFPDEYGSESESRWYPAERGHPEPRHQGEVDQRRVPEPRTAPGYDPEHEPAGSSRYADLIPDAGGREPRVLEMGLDAQAAGAGTIGRRSGEHLPPLP